MAAQVAASSHGVTARGMNARMSRIAWVSLLLLACGPSGRTDEVTIHPDAPPIPPFDACTVYTAREASYGNDHVAVCTPLTPASMPPTSGTHFGSWADFGVYDAPVPWGFLVHAMEHGAVVIGYRDDVGPALAAELAEIVAAQPADPLCRGDDPARFILAPAPDLEWPIAVLAWERLYLATCLDRPSMQAFIDEVYAEGPENLCAPGVDGSATGWCPG